jgi:L-lysine exporter family protein LysE/ArgO
MSLNFLFSLLPNLSAPEAGAGVAALHGAVLALGLILPLGVQNLFIFQQGAYQKRLWNAMPVVLTAALCDTLLITLSVTGVSLVVLSRLWLKILMMGAGSLFLLYMGFTAWRSTGSSMAAKNQEAYSVKQQISFAASVSLLNPHAIMDTMGVIGTTSLQYAGDTRVLFAAACIAVSWIWFMGLAAAGRLMGRLDTSGRLMLVLNKLSALFIWMVALGLLYTVYTDLMT